MDTPKTSMGKLIAAELDLGDDINEESESATKPAPAAPAKKASARKPKKAETPAGSAPPLPWTPGPGRVPRRGSTASSPAGPPAGSTGAPAPSTRPRRSTVATREEQIGAAVTAGLKQQKAAAEQAEMDSIAAAVTAALSGTATVTAPVAAAVPIVTKLDVIKNDAKAWILRAKASPTITLSHDELVKQLVATHGADEALVKMAVLFAESEVTV